MTYTHDEVRAIVKFVLEEERRLEAEEKNEPKVTAAVTAEETEKPSAPVPKKKPGPKPKKKPPLDHGKIMALHKGKWPVAKIADEMGCSEQAVRNHIAQEEKKDAELN